MASTRKRVILPIYFCPCVNLATCMWELCRGFCTSVLFHCKGVEGGGGGGGGVSGKFTLPFDTLIQL